jgi:type IV secretion system protein TrbJ
MKTRSLWVTVSAVALAIAISAAAPEPALAQWAVIDVANLTQNVLIAARALEQINNQIQSLQNETAMLENMARNLTSLNVSELGGISGDLQQISSLMNQAQGISPRLLSDAETRWQNARDAFQQTMQVQSQIAETVQSDSAKLAALVNASQGSEGNLQVSQATNQLLALSIKQQLQIETMMAAQDRADALTEANSAEAEEEGRAAFQAFLGSSNAYSPN